MTNTYFSKINFGILPSHDSGRYLPKYSPNLQRHSNISLEDLKAFHRLAFLTKELLTFKKSTYLSYLC